MPMGICQDAQDAALAAAMSGALRVCCIITGRLTRTLEKRALELALTNM